MQFAPSALKDLPVAARRMSGTHPLSSFEASMQSGQSVLLVPVQLVLLSKLSTSIFKRHHLPFRHLAACLMQTGPTQNCYRSASSTCNLSVSAGRLKKARSELAKSGKKWQTHLPKPSPRSMGAQARKRGRAKLQPGASRTGRPPHQWAHKKQTYSMSRLRGKGNPGISRASTCSASAPKAKYGFSWHRPSWQSTRSCFLTSTSAAMRVKSYRPCQVSKCALIEGS